jgi:hypothetical protein
VRDDDFDRRRARSGASAEVSFDRTRVPGKATLVDADRARSSGDSAAPGKRTLVQDEYDHQSHGLGRDPAVEVEFHVRKARELIAKLAADPATPNGRIARSDLQCHLSDAKHAAAQCSRDARGNEAVASVFQVLLDAHPFVDATRSEAPDAIAQRGIQGPDQRLPFHDEIQRAFGPHDVSGIHAHVGGAAADASRDLGARAYAHGDHVAFASAPSLELAAHEAAHVIQQRAGVSLKGIDGGANDAYELHADAVASAVVRGESAAPLLANLPAGTGGSTSHAVQRKKGDEPAGHSAFSPPEYVQKYLSQIRDAISDRLGSVGLDAPHPRLGWVDQAGAIAAITGAIWSYVRAVPDQALKRLMMLAQPADLYAIVDHVRRDAGGVGWQPQVGQAIALAFDEPVVRSLTRMGPRLRVQLDLAGKMPRASDLVASCPLDGLIAEVLVKPGLLLADPHKPKGNDTPGRPFAHGVREVEYTWMGKQDPQLWNWIHVTAPANATVEHVAHTPLFGDHVQDGSEQAYRIAASPPYFGIPFETAKRVPEAFGAAPEDVKQRLAHGEGPRFADSSPLAKSTASDEAALAQAPNARKGDLPLEHALERVDHQLAFLQRELGPWKLADRLAGASGFADRRRAELRSDRRTANKWTNAVAQQERTLFAVSSDIAELLRGFGERGATPDHAAQLSPYVRVLDAYAHAAGASHVAALGEGALAEARRQRDLLPMGTGRGPDRSCTDARSRSARRGAELRYRRLRGRDDAARRTRRGSSPPRSAGR